MSDKDIQAFCSRVKERMGRVADEAQGFYRTGEEFLAMMDVWHEMMQDGTLVRPRRYMGQIIAECDCSRPGECESDGRCLSAAAEPIGNDSPLRRHARAEIPDVEGNYNGRDRGKTSNPGIKLSELDLKFGDKIRPVSDARGGSIKDGKLWSFSHIDVEGQFFGTDPLFPCREPLALAADYGWDVVERAEEYKGIPDGVTEVKGWPSSKAPETIVAAAIQIDGVTISLPKPARHGTILAAADWYLKTQPGQEVQGFITSTGRFVNRIQARHIADIAGQKPGRSGGRDNPELYSEDLW